MKRLFQFVSGAVLLLAPLSSSSVAQTAPVSNDQQQIARAVRELQEQQAVIAQNETKIEEKVVAIEEAVRQARIFANRAGAAHR
jgi:ABC-type transporter MlaC component